VNRIL